MLELIDVEKNIINKPDYVDDGFLLCAPYYADKYPEILDVFNNEKYLSFVENILEKWFILYLYSNNCVPPNNGKTKAVRIHVDTPRTIPNYNYAVGSLILLDDFNEVNGATWLLPASQNQKEKPDEDFFYKNAERLIAPKGSVLFFNPSVWHSAGINNSDNWRSCLILAFCKAWMKQRVDIPRFIKHIDANKISPKVQQILGFNAQPPASFDEFYNKEEQTYTQPFT
jgi:ectoine hydroxylase-related dioxygenase (phytanoyl-CoA dioxygenase family)